ILNITNKCKVVVFNGKQKKPEIHLEGDNLEIVNAYKYLGVWFDSKLETPQRDYPNESEKKSVHHDGVWRMQNSPSQILCKPLGGACQTYPRVCCGGMGRRRMGSS